MSEEHHRREADKMKTWKLVVIWSTLFGFLPTIAAVSVIIWNSGSVIVHASDYVKAIPCIQKQVEDHEMRIKTVEISLPYIKDALDRLLDHQGIARPREKRP